MYPFGGSMINGFSFGSIRPIHSFSGSVPSFGKKSATGDCDFFFNHAEVITPLKTVIFAKKRKINAMCPSLVAMFALMLVNVRLANAPMT